jgi:hypothetical protein
MSAKIDSTYQKALINNRKICRSFGFEDDSGDTRYKTQYAYYDSKNKILKNKYLICEDKIVTNSSANDSTISCIDINNKQTNCCVNGDTLVSGTDKNAIDNMISCPQKAIIPKTCEKDYQTDNTISRTMFPTCKNNFLPRTDSNSKLSYPYKCYCDCKSGYFGKDCSIQSGCVDKNGRFTNQSSNEYLCNDGFRHNAAKIVYQVYGSSERDTTNKFMTVDSNGRLHADPNDKDHAWFRFYKLAPNGYNFLLKHECSKNDNDMDNCWCKAGPDPADNRRTVITCNNEHPYNKSMDEMKDYIFSNKHNNQFGRPAGNAADSTLGNFLNQSNYYCTPKYTTSTTGCPNHTYVQYNTMTTGNRPFSIERCATPGRDATLIKTNSSDYSNRDKEPDNRCDYHTQW